MTQLCDHCRAPESTHRRLNTVGYPSTTCSLPLESVGLCALEQEKSPVVATIVIQDSGGSSMVVMESIQYRKRDDLTITLERCGSSPYCYPLTDSLIRLRRVEMRFNVFPEHASQMVCAEDDDVIQAFSSHSAKETLADRIHPRRAWRDLHDFDIGAFGDSIECRAILGVAILNQRLWSGTERSHLAQLLCISLLRRCSRYADVHYALGVDIHDEEREDRTEPAVVRVKKVTHRRVVVLQERLP
jgi:hypothetical protein